MRVFIIIYDLWRVYKENVGKEMVYFRLLAQFKTQFPFATPATDPPQSRGNFLF